MKKIFAYVGSKKNNSNTVELVKLIIEKLKENSNEEIVGSIYTPNNIIVKDCIGCERCFYEGKCSIDDTDDFQILRNKMLEADFIIWATPIYAASVSGDMKRFIDRLSSWLHLMNLAGKPSMAITTSNGSGIKETLRYMYIIMTHLGLYVTKQVNENIYTFNQFKEEQLQDRCREYAKIIENYLTGKEKVKSTDNLEIFFKHKKGNMLKMAENMDENNEMFELKYWKETGYLSKDTFSELLECKR